MTETEYGIWLRGTQGRPSVRAACDADPAPDPAQTKPRRITPKGGSGVMMVLQAPVGSHGSRSCEQTRHTEQGDSVVLRFTANDAAREIAA